MRTNFYALLLLFATHTVSAQHHVSGNLLDDKGEAAAYATVMLLAAADSTLVKGEITDEAGRFSIEAPSGSYLLKASSVGFEPLMSAVFALASDKDLGDMRLGVAAAELKEVTVTAKKPLIEMKGDRTVVNIDGNPLAAGGSALDALKRSPGVIVDNNSNITLRGKSVLVMIDGRRNYMSQEELANFLRNMPADNISSFELITNPSAKFDAQGGSVINIRLKKNMNFGTNGSVYLGGGYGWRPKANLGGNVNYRNEKINVFGNLGANFRQSENRLWINRKVGASAERDIFEQNANTRSEGKSSTGKAGIDYNISKNHVVGALVNYSLWDNSNTTDNHTDIFAANGVDEFLNTITDEAEKGVDLAYNLNYKGTLDTLGREISVDADYSDYRSRQLQDIGTNFFLSETTTPYRSWIQTAAQPTNIGIYAIKADYVHPFAKGPRLEAGVKYSYVGTDNVAEFDSLQNGVWVNDAGRSNTFYYKEYIAAAYANASHSIKKWQLNAGLRLEDTRSEGNSPTTGQIVPRHYTNLFPSGSVAYNHSDKLAFAANYSYRINRPSYQQLNPFLFVLDPYTFRQGNPFLRPQYSHNFEFSTTVMQAASLSFGFEQINDAMMQITSQDDAKKSTYQTDVNLARGRNYTIMLGSPIPITKKINAYVWGMSMWNQMNAVYDGAPINYKAFSWFTGGQVSAEFPRGFSAELSAEHQSTIQWGIFSVKPQTDIGLALKKNFLQDRLEVSANVTDIFFSSNSRVDVNFQNMDFQLKDLNETRRATLRLKYKFGNQQVKSARRRSTATEDERNRIGGSKGNK